MMNIKTIAAILLGFAVLTTACDAEVVESDQADGSCSSCGTFASDLESNALCADQVDAYNDVIECVCDDACADSCGAPGDFCDSGDKSDSCKTCLSLPDLLGGCNTTIWLCQSN